MMETEDDYTDYDIGTFHKMGRYLMYVFNAIFIAFASVLFALCFWIRVHKDMDDYIGDFNFPQFWEGAIVLMVGAMFVMAAPMIGACGTYFWNEKLLVGYLAVCGISFIVNLGGAAFMLTIGLESTLALPYIQENFRNLISQYYHDMEAATLVDIIHQYIGCCGGYSPLDWQKIHMPVPNSCRDQVTGNQWRDSCAEVLSWYLQYRTRWVSGIALCTCFLQLFTLVYFLCMFRGIKEKRAAYRDSYQESK